MSDEDKLPKAETAFWDQSLTRMTALLIVAGMIFGAGLRVGQVIADGKGQARTAGSGQRQAIIHPVWMSIFSRRAKTIRIWY